MMAHRVRIPQIQDNVTRAQEDGEDAIPETDEEYEQFGGTTSKART
jgi:hypothetical protein